MRSSLPPEWVTREQGSDYGVDLEVEFPTGRGVLSGEVVKVQVKGHDSIHFRRAIQTERIKPATALYWLRLRMPILLASVDCKTERVYWVDAAAQLRTLPANAFDKKSVPIGVPASALVTGPNSHAWLQAKARFDYDWRTTSQGFDLALDRLVETAAFVAWLDRCDKWMPLYERDARRLHDLRRRTLVLAHAVGLRISAVHLWEHWLRAALEKGYPAGDELPYEFASEAGWELLTLHLSAMSAYQKRIVEVEHSFWHHVSPDVFDRWHEHEFPQWNSRADVQQFAFECEAL